MSAAAESVLLRVQAEQIAASIPPHPMGRPSALADPDVLQLLLAAIADGVDYERACKAAGIAPRTIYNWKTRAEQGDETAIRFVQALEKAEAEVERRVTRNVLKASDSPQYWAAGMTYLERRYPERYGRRDDSGVTARVQVSIGDVSISAELTTLRGGNQVNVIGNYQTQTESVGLTAQPLAGALSEPFAGEGEGRKSLPPAKAERVSGGSGSSRRGRSRGASRDSERPDAEPPRCP